MAQDDEGHAGAMAGCVRRNRFSELLQKNLESRYAGSIQVFKAAKDTSAVAALWADAVHKGDVSGAFWAALTHPLCDEALQELLLRDIHLLQHQAGAAVRVEVNRFNDLIQEHGVLAREFGKVQKRCTRIIAEKSAEIRKRDAELVRQRAIAIGKDTRIAYLTQDLENLKASLPEYERTSRLQKKLERLSARHTALEAQNAQLRQQLCLAQGSLTALLEKEGTAAMPASQRHELVAQAPITFHLRQKTVLCVGGRNGDMANYRDIIEKAGGRFAHHDGEEEDNQGALDSSLAAADLVICQTGCINHNAYWRVKDFCKRTGKQCVYVENPSSSSLARCLQQISGGEAAPERKENPACSSV